MEITLCLKFKFCFIKTKRLVRITFNGLINDEIHVDNSSAKQGTFILRPCICCNLEVFSDQTFHSFSFKKRFFIRWPGFPS